MLREGAGVGRKRIEYEPEARLAALRHPEFRIGGDSFGAGHGIFVSISLKI